MRAKRAKGLRFRLKVLMNRGKNRKALMVKFKWGLLTSCRVVSSGWTSICPCSGADNEVSIRPTCSSACHYDRSTFAFSNMYCKTQYVKVTENFSLRVREKKERAAMVKGAKE